MPTTYRGIKRKVRSAPAIKAAAPITSEKQYRSAISSFRDIQRGEFVYQELRNAIAAGQFQQGERIREEDVAKSLGVSRTPVREALRRLQTRGLLELAAGRGLVIAELSRQQVLELYAMREILEGAAARLAAQHAMESEIAHLRHLLAGLRKETNPQKLADLNRGFHHTICDAAHNRYMQQSLNDLGDALALLRDTTFSLEGRPKTAEDFTYLKVIGWGWFYLSTILDDYSRFIVAWELCTTMKATDVTATIELTLKASELDGGGKRPRLLLDNGSSYVAGDLATWLGNRGVAHVRVAPNHPMTQGKIERWAQTMKNRILLENDFLPGDLDAKIGSFVDHDNHCRYHESLGNLTPADVYTGRGQAILERREAIKQKTIEHRRLLHRQATA